VGKQIDSNVREKDAKETAGSWGAAFEKSASYFSSMEHSGQ
jgi:hypothetical protein